MEAKKLEGNFFLVLFLLSALMAFLIFLPYFTPLVLALTLAVAFAPVYEKILGWLGGRSFLASFLMIILLLLLVIIPMFSLGFQLFQEARGLYSSFSSGDSGILQYFSGKIDSMTRGLIPGFSIDFRDWLQKGIGWFSDNLGSIFSSAAKLTADFFIALFALFYFFKDGKKLREFIVRYSPLSIEHNNQIFEKLRLTLNSVVRGTLIVALVQGITAGIGFFLFGIPNPVFWATLVVFAALIPTIGVAIIMLPAVIYLYFSGHIPAAISLLAWSVLVVGLIDNLLRPYVLERGTKIHPLVILLSVLGGFQFFGPIGFLAGPVALSFFFTLLEMYSHFIGTRSRKADA